MQHLGGMRATFSSNANDGGLRLARPACSTTCSIDGASIVVIVVELSSMRPIVRAVASVSVQQTVMLSAAKRMARNADRFDMEVFPFL